MIFEELPIFLRQYFLSNIIEVYSKEVYFTHDRFSLIRKILYFKSIIYSCRY